MLLGLFLAALDTLIMATALPAIAGDLGDLGQVSWIFTSYLLTFTASMPLYGKLGDLYGRKRVLQAAILVFLAASALAGASRTMGQLVAGRALQGVGGGGLVALSSAVIGDIVSPRERGRYAGLTSGVWALSSLLGPVAGGLFVDHLSWRWAFYVNLPTGLVAMALVGVGLPANQRRLRHAVDYLGAALLVGAVSCALLVTAWAGGEHGPTAVPVALPALAAPVLAVLFVARERRAPEPLVPLHLFRNPVVAVCSTTTFLVGAANFGMAILVPLFVQVVNGDGATESGLVLMPVSVGILVASTVVGRRVARTGRYRLFPPVGSVVLATGLVLLTTMQPGTPRALQWGYTLTTGLGLGMVTPVVLLAVQNAVRYRDMGTATALATFSRSMGQAVGSAVLGAIMAARLVHHLERALPADVAGLDGGAIRADPDLVARLAPAVRADVVDAFRRAISDAFWVSVPVAVAAAAVALFIRHLALRETIGDGDSEGGAGRHGARPVEPPGAAEPAGAPA